jgi:multiple sugar transport system permease protein
VSLALGAVRVRRRSRHSLEKIAAAILGVLIAFWTLLPVYNLLLIALSDDGDEFTGAVYPAEPNLESFTAVLTEGNRYLEGFWHQFGNSVYMGLATMVITVVIGSLAAFAMGRIKLRKAWLFGHLPLITYAVPASFLAIPFTRLMSIYGLTDNLWSVIAAEVAFATPYAILICHQYGKLIPLELDEAARVDGATPLQVYLRIYLPLMTPALAAVATFALLVAWNEYQYQFLLLTSERNWTVAAAIDQFFDSDEAPWNYMMAMSLVYALPPIAVYYGLRRYMVAGLTMGGVKF